MSNHSIQFPGTGEIQQYPAMPSSQSRHPYLSNTCYVLDPIPAGAYVDTSTMPKVENVVFTQNSIDPRTGRPLVPTRTNHIPEINEDERFERLDSVSPTGSPPRTQSQAVPRPPSPPTAFVRPSPTSSTEVQPSRSPRPHRQRPGASIPFHNPHGINRNFPYPPSPREESPESGSPSSVRANAPSRRRRHASHTRNQPPARCSSRLQKTSRSLDQLSTVRVNPNFGSSRATNDRRAPQLTRSDARDILANVNLSLPGEPSTSTANTSDQRKRKRIEAATSEEPKSKVRKTQPLLIEAAPEPPEEPKATQSQSQTKRKRTLDQDASTAARIQAKIAKNRARSVVSKNQTSLLSDLPMSSQGSSAPSTRRSKRAKPSAVSPHQLLLSQSSSMPQTSQDSTTSSVRRSARLQAKRNLSLSNKTI